MKYRKLDITNFPLLNKVVFDIYELTTGDDTHIYSTVPNGIIGISIVLDGHSQIQSEESWHLSPPISIYGLINKPDVINISKKFREIAIGFNPYYLQLLLKNSMSDIVGKSHNNAFEFFNKDDLSLLYEKLYYSKNDNQILSAVNTFLMKQIISTKEDNRLKHAIDLLYKQQVSNVTELSKSINLSSVSVRNLFKDGVGQSPKEIIKILRIYKALQFSPLTHHNLTQLSYHLGYFDQSHFIHDFKQFFGVSPNSYFKQTELTFDFYNYGRWKGNIFEKI